MHLSKLPKRIFSFFCITILLFESNLLAYSDHSFFDLLRPAKVGECYPVSPYSKKYLSYTKNMFYSEAIFTCEYKCINKKNESIAIVATSKIRDWLWEDDYSFVCEGYRENMRWVPMESNINSRSGRYDYFGASPFLAKSAPQIEFQKWFQHEFQIKNQKLKSEFQNILHAPPKK